MALAAVKHRLLLLSVTDAAMLAATNGHTTMLAALNVT